MRRLGALLMIIGANLVAGSIGVGVYFANLACVLSARGCAGGLVAAYADLMGSRDGVAFWVGIVVGVLVFWRGMWLRRRDDGGRG